jgi:hypothetical protein
MLPVAGGNVGMQIRQALVSVWPVLKSVGSACVCGVRTFRLCCNCQRKDADPSL